MNNLLRRIFLTLGSFALLALTAAAPARGQTVEVTSADPSSAVQGTLSLDVTVSGNGFDSTAQVKFLVTGTADPGGITVKKVSVRGSKKLIATIDVTDTAAVANFDIEVSLSSGRKGIGTTKFTVLAKPNSDPCAYVSGAPAFAFQTRSGSNLTPQIYVADSSGACVRFIGSLAGGQYYGTPTYMAFRLLEPDQSGKITGRIATIDHARGMVLLQFTVDPTVAGMQIQDASQFVMGMPGLRYDLSPDGRRLAVMQLVLNSPTAGDYTYTVKIGDIDACISDPPNCSFETAYVETVRTDGLGLDHLRWGGHGYIYVEKRFDKNINPLITRIAADPPYSTALQTIWQPVTPRSAIFDVQATVDDDVLVMGTTDAASDYCYKVSTISVSSCALGTCAVNPTNMIASFYTSAETVGTQVSVLTQPVGRNCSPTSTVVRSQSSGSSSPTQEQLLRKGESPSSAN